MENIPLDEGRQVVHITVCCHGCQLLCGKSSRRAGADGVAQSLPANASAVLNEGGLLQLFSLPQR